jgi:histidinol-phosphate aminotransferase
MTNSQSQSANSAPQAKKGIMDISIYMPGKSAAPAGIKLHKLSSNETPLGPSPKALKAIQEASEHLELYPDGQSDTLKKAIGEVYGLNTDNLICGNGSDELLSMIGAAYLETDDEVIFTEHGFLMYKIVALTSGAVPVVVKETNEHADVDAILAAVTPRTRIIFLANPNNPTGTYIPMDKVRRLHAGLPTNVVLVLDAAYAEYVRRNDYEAGVELVASSQNVIMTRTFSKIHGLAALRIGWAYAPRSMIEILERVRGPFNVNALAIAAGAAAIRDRAHIDKAVLHNEKSILHVTAELEKLGLRVTPSVGNFLLVHFPEATGKSAAEADAYLTSKGILLRAVTGYGFPNALRMTLGTDETNAFVISTLRDFLA